MESPNYFAIITANVRYDKKLKANEKLLYAEITALCNCNGHCFASNKYFAELYDVSITSISKWISNLVKFGYLKSVITYKKGTKEIDKRYLTIVQDPIEEKFNTPLTKVQDPIEEKFKDNNTSINNNIINAESNNSATKSSSNNSNKKNSYSKNFELLWNRYDKKTSNKNRSQKIYLKRWKNTDIKILLEAIDKYKATTDLTFKKDFDGFLNGLIDSYVPKRVWVVDRNGNKILGYFYDSENKFVSDEQKKLNMNSCDIEKYITENRFGYVA